MYLYAGKVLKDYVGWLITSPMCPYDACITLLYKIDSSVSVGLDIGIVELQSRLSKSYLTLKLII